MITLMSVHQKNKIDILCSTIAPKRVVSYYVQQSGNDNLNPVQSTEKWAKLMQSRARPRVRFRFKLRLGLRLVLSVERAASCFSTNTRL
jgi:hypothetical protein